MTGQLDRKTFWQSEYFQMRRRAYVYSFVAMVILVVAGWQSATLLERYLQQEVREEITIRVNSYGSALTRSINRRLALISGLSSFIETELSQTEDLDYVQLEHFAADLYDSTEGILNIAIAPGGVMQFVYPYEENKSVLGYEPALDEHLTVRADVQRTIDTRKIILSQPVELIQGGQGVIARQAIFEGNNYWGLANIVVAVIPMLEDAGLLSAQNEMALALKDQTGQIFYGSEDVFASDAVTYTIYLPEGSWELASMPIDGWSNSYQPVMLIYRFLGLILIVALTLLVYQYARRYKYLSILVEQRTRDLQESETQYRELTNNSLVGIYIVQHQVMQFGNQGLADLFGYESPEEIIGLHIRNLVAPESWEEVEKEMRRRESGQKRNSHYHFKGVRADGSLMDIESLSVTIAHHGQPAVQGVLTDITERVLIDQKLRKSEEHFRSVIQAQRDLIYRYSSDGTITLANDAYCQFVDKPTNEILGTSLFETIASEDQETVREHIDSLSVKNPVATHENINFNCKGESRWFEWTDLAIISEIGEIVEYQAIGRDITERVQAEQSLLLEKEKAQKYLEVAGVMILVIGADQKVSLINKRGCQILGYTSDEILGSNWFETCIPDRNRDEIIFIFSRLMADEIEPVEYFENRVLTKDGKERLIAWHNTILKDSTGMITGTLSSGEDITEQAKSEAQLKLQSHALDSTANAVVITDSEGNIQWTNPAFSALTGYSLKEVMGQNLRILKSDQQDEPFYKNLWETISAGEIWHGEIINKRKDGALYTEEMTIAPLLSDGGEISNFIAVKQDITERVQTAMTLQKYTKRLETLNTVNAALSTSLELDKVLEIILGQIGKVLPFDSGAIFLHVKDGLRVVIDRGNLPSSKGLVFPAEDELYQELQHTRTPLILNNLKDDARFKNWGQSANIASWMGVPLIVRNTLIGFLTLDCNQVGAYSSEQADLALPFAAQAAQAIENARQFKAAHRRLQKLAALRKIDQAITSSFDLQVTLDILLGHLLTQLEVDAAVVLRYEHTLQSLTFCQGQGFRTKALQHTNLRLGSGHAGKVALQRKSIYIPDWNQLGSNISESPELKEEGFVAYYGVPLIARDALMGVLEIFHSAELDLDDEWSDYLQALAEQAAIAMENIALFDNLQRSNVKLLQAYDATIEGWARALELRDMEIEGHSRRAVALTMDLAKLLGIREEEMIHIRRGALLHDIGKMGVSDAILQNSGKLTDEEWQIMRQHPVYAYDWLSSIEYLHPALDIPYCHHEKWDGSGYPRGLKGEQIPLAARIFAVVDVWDALLSDRPYRQAWSKERTMTYIREQSGQHFDPQVVGGFLNMVTWNS